MNEIQLSDSLPIIETEIRQYQNLAGESIFEIGRRLKHVKENDLVHGEFGKWLESIKLNDSQARKFVKVFDENLNRSTSNTLGLEALYQISTLPEPERTKEHTTSKGETKTPDEMTVRELRELKKQLKENEEKLSKTESMAESTNKWFLEASDKLEARERENEILQSKLENAENQEPEVVEKYTDPEDYEDIKNMNEHLKGENQRYKEMADSFREEVKNNKPIEIEPVDQTDLILQMLNSIEDIIFSSGVKVNEEEITNKFKKIIERLGE